MGPDSPTEHEDEASGVPDEVDAVYIATGDPCIDLENLLVGPTGEWAHDLSSDEEIQLFRDAVSSLGDSAITAFDEFIAAFEVEEPPAMVEAIALIDGLDNITFEPCGWPLWGALFAVLQVVDGAARFCAIDAVIDGSNDEELEPEFDPPRCEAFESPFPSELPCFRRNEIPVGDDDIFALLGLWTLLDCGSGVEVGWDEDVGTWAPLD